MKQVETNKQPTEAGDEGFAIPKGTQTRAAMSQYLSAKLKMPSGMDLA